MKQCKIIDCLAPAEDGEDFCASCGFVFTSTHKAQDQKGTSVSVGPSGPFHERSQKTPVPMADDLLHAAAGHMTDRASIYDAPGGERSMAKTVVAFNALTGHQLSETHGWIMMALLKIARANQGEFKLDNYEDLIAYTALAGESAIKEAEEA